MFRGLPTEALDALLNPVTEEEERWRHATDRSLNLIGRNSQQQADLLFREAPLFEVGEEEAGAQEAVDRIVKTSRLPITLFKLAETALPCKGDAVLKVHIEADGGARVTSVPPEIVEWEKDPLNCEKYTAASVN